MSDRKPYEKVKVKKTKDHVAEITGEIPVDILARHEEAAFAGILEQFEAPGFRKGKVPEDIVRKHVSAMHILEDAAEPAIDDAYRAILEDEAIEALGTPEVTVTKMAPGNPLAFTIRVGVMPTFTLPDYKAMAKEIAAVPLGEVSDQDVDDAIRTIQTMRTANVPEEAAKEGVKLPEITDEYVRSLGNFTDLADFRAKLRTSIAEERETEARRARREAIAGKLIEKTAITLPSPLVEEEVRVMQERRRADMERMGVTLEEYLKRAGKATEEELAEEERSYIERQMKTKFVFDRIAETEHLKAEDAEIERNLAVLSVRHPDADPGRLVNYIRAMIVNEKVLQFLEGQK